MLVFFTIYQLWLDWWLQKTIPAKIGFPVAEQFLRPVEVYGWSTSWPGTLQKSLDTMPHSSGQPGEGARSSPQSPVVLKKPRGMTILWLHSSPFQTQPRLAAGIHVWLPENTDCDIFGSYPPTLMFTYFKVLNNEAVIHKMGKKQQQQQKSSVVSGTCHTLSE